MRTLAAPDRPTVHAERALVTAILGGEYLPGATLPAERESGNTAGGHPAHAPRGAATAPTETAG